MRKLASSPNQSSPKGGGLGAFLLPVGGRGAVSRLKEGVSPAHVSVTRVAEVEAGTALPAHSRFPLPESLRGMFENSQTFVSTWQQAAAIAFAEHRLLLRAQRLIELAAQLRTTRFRLEQHGLRSLCQLGCRTTLYRLGEVLATYVFSANKTEGLSPDQLIPGLEQLAIEGLRQKYGPEIHAKDLTAILGGARSRDFAIAAEALVPSIRKHRCVLFPLAGIERAVRVMAAQANLARSQSAHMGRSA